MGPGNVIRFQPGRVQMVDSNGGAANKSYTGTTKQILVYPGNRPDQQYFCIRQIGITDFPAIEKLYFAVATERFGKQGHIFVGNYFHLKHNSHNA
jgi:hypothetical protein